MLSGQPLNCFLFNRASALEQQDFNRAGCRIQPETKPVLAHTQPIDIRLSLNFLDITLIWIVLEFIEMMKGFLLKLSIEPLHVSGGCLGDFGDGPFACLRASL